MNKASAEYKQGTTWLDREAKRVYDYDGEQWIDRNATDEEYDALEAFVVSSAPMDVQIEHFRYVAAGRPKDKK